jgi:hypothetical protein
MHCPLSSGLEKQVVCYEKEDAACRRMLYKSIRR